MNTEQSKITKEKQIQKYYLAAFFSNDQEKVAQVRDEAISLGMCVNMDGNCDDERCYCKNY